MGDGKKGRKPSVLDLEKRRMKKKEAWVAIAEKSLEARNPSEKMVGEGYGGSGAFEWRRKRG